MPREMKQHKILVCEAKSPLRHSCSPSERRRFSPYFRNRDSPENQYLLRNLSTHSAPRSIANISWRDRRALPRLQPSKVDGKHHLSPAELALAFFSKVERLRSRRKSPRPPPSYGAKCWSQSLPVTSSRKKHFSLRHSNSPTSSCSEILSQSSSCTGKSWQSEPPMPSPRPRYSLVTQASKSQCCCGSHGRGCAKDCEFCCAFDCARVKVTNGKKSGFQILDSSRKGSPIVHVDGKIECRSTSNCKLQRLKFDDDYCTRSLERIIVPGTRDTGVCTESESRHSMFRDSERAVITDHRHDRVFDILDCDSEGSVAENCGEKIMHKATSCRHNVHDKIPAGNTNDFHRHNVHDAATGNARDILRLIFHDKAVGNDRDINRYYHDDLQRDDPKYLARHNVHRDIGVGSAHDVSRHVYYENGAANSREDYDDGPVFHCDEHFGPDVDVRPTCNVRDHSRDRAISNKTADRRTRDRECHKPRMKVRDRITVNDCMKDNTKLSNSRENSDSGSYECVQNRRNAKNHSFMKRIGSSKMSFVLGNKPRYFPTGFSDRSVVTESTSGSIRDSLRRHGHVSRK